MRVSAWWQSLEGDAEGNSAGGGAPGRAPRAQPAADGPPPAAAESLDQAPSTAAAGGARGGWRVDLSPFVAGGAGAGSTRGTGAEGVANRAAALGLATRDLTWASVQWMPPAA
eukprot:5681880-Pleurochrysis_carterae.AAC.1